MVAHNLAHPRHIPPTQPFNMERRCKLVLMQHDTLLWQGRGISLQKREQTMEKMFQRKGASQTLYGFEMFLSRMQFRLFVLAWKQVHDHECVRDVLQRCHHYFTPLLTVAALLNMHKLLLNRSNPLSSARNMQST